MRSAGWGGLKLVHRSVARGFPLGKLRLGVALALLLSAALTACESSRSFERTADGSILYVDELSPAQKAQAREVIVETLRRGLDVYDLQIADELEIFFHIKRQPTAREYAISVADKLRIDTLNETAANREVQVEVRPDGRISMPLIGPVMAAGKTADALARELERRYAQELSQPQITVNVTEAHSLLKDFIEAVGAPSKSRSIIDKVLPDGTISLPLLRPVQARGHSLRDLKRDIDAAYAASGLDISVSLIPRSLRAGTAMVLGEVVKPGRIDSDRPQTVLMGIAQAGGVTTSGSLGAVRIFYIGNDGMPRVRSVNLKNVIEGLALEEDMIVPNNSVIYVPPTELAKTGRLLDAVLRDILRFQGFSIGGTYLLNNPSGGSTVIPSP
jgi:protein involved in polysaccharide export with SLBB domain